MSGNCDRITVTIARVHDDPLDVLGKDADRFMKAFDVTPRGNWEPHEESIPKKQSVLRVLEDGGVAQRRDGAVDLLGGVRGVVGHRFRTLAA